MRDPDDLIVLACALSGNADYVVSGDPDLLAIHPFKNIPIVSPTQFAHIISLI
ncbi:MAG: hypothetical protein IAE89_08200 [Anaerolineae bacterium]|nr:hypothetical protein [Anaerolineae bacterium]